MKKKIFALIISALLLVTGCSMDGKESLLPKEIVEAAIETNQETKDYYAESLMEVFHNDELIEKSNIREWIAEVDGEIKKKSEIESDQTGKMVSLFEKDSGVMYSEEENEVYRMEINPSEAELNMSVKERTQKELEILGNMFEMETVGEEELDGKQVYHIKGKGSPKEESTLLGNYEAWIDKKNWTAVKVIANNGDVKVVITIKEIDLSPHFDKDTFSLDIPSDAKEIDLNELAEFEKVTLEEAYEELGESLLLVKDGEYKLEKIEVNNLAGPNSPKQFIFTYTKGEMDVFEIVVFGVVQEGLNQFDESLGFREEEVRGKSAQVMDDIIKMINFEEDRNSYVVMINSPELTVEDMLIVIENMEQYK